MADDRYQTMSSAEPSPVEPKSAKTANSAEMGEGHMNGQTGPPAYQEASSKQFEDVLNSEIGISTLLNRLKQSIASVRDFAAFLKKRSTLEEEHAQGLKKLCRATHEGIRRPEHRQGSYARQFDELTRVHERIADHGLQFAQSLHQMHDELMELTTIGERGRKHWKQTGLSAEKRVQDAESAMDKAKTKYDSLADDYDRVRTGDKQSGKKFGLKGPRSAAQLEEELQRKVQAADADYASKVQTANGQRQELLSTIRPQGVKALQDLIRECDSALTMQMQRFAMLNETLLLNNGLSVSPMPAQGDAQPSAPKSIRDVVTLIDNDKDLHDYISSFSAKVPPKPSEFRYERHPSLGPRQQTPPVAVRQQQQQHPHPVASGPPQPSAPVPLPPPHQPEQSHAPQLPPIPQEQRQSYGFSQGSPMEAQHSPDSDYGLRGPPPPQHFPPPMVPPMAGGSHLPPMQYGSVPHSQPTPPPTNSPLAGDLPPLKPVFGMTLDALYSRDGSAVPIVVYQCLQAVDMYGLDVEGIYRLSGTSSHVARIKAMFDHDSTLVDFRNPENFLHDVNSVAGALKQFFRDLPDPVMTTEHYAAFIEASRIDDDIVRRDSLHAVINSLPDPNYATLRALILHLNRVQEHSQVNRMNSSNLAICFGPTLMGAHTGQHISDAGWQVRVVDTILQNTYQIFDDD